MADLIYVIYFKNLPLLAQGKRDQTALLSIIFYVKYSFFATLKLAKRKAWLKVKVLISPSIFAADLLHLDKEIERTVDSGADMIHFDVMDGVYVPNISLGFDFLSAIRKSTDLPIDVHMMTVRPEAYIERLAKAGADIVTIHNDIADEDKIKTMLMDIRSYGMMAAVALKPAVPAEAILPYIDMVDMILVMTVEPGFSGQSFMDMSDKIKKVKEYIGEAPISIQVDGGINAETIKICAEAGANVFVCGSAAYRATDMKKTIGDIKNAAQESIVAK